MGPEDDSTLEVVPPPAVSLDDVLAARETIGNQLHRTPTFTSATLSRLTGADVFLKAELFQRTGSFKPRGVLNKLATLGVDEKRAGVITISAGNHAQAVAWAAAQEGIDALVVMWETASPMKVAAARGYGATVDTEARSIPEAFERLDELTAESGRTLVHPYDDPLVIAGAGTVGLEILDDVPDVDVVLVQVGGGGLISGIATAVKGVRPRARIVAVEPELSAALHESLAAGHPVTVQPTSIADGLAGPYAGDLAVGICTALDVESVLVAEDDLAEGLRFTYARAKLACEVAGGATAAALLAGKVPLDDGEKVAAVVSGGNISPETASAILAGR